MDERIRRFRQKLAASPKRLNTCLAEADVQAFERRHGIVLPESYRAFLLHFGNGGEGPPCFGIPKLGEPADDMTPEEERVWTELRLVGRPFPFTKPWVWEDGEASGEGTREQIDHGSLFIGNNGCGQYWLLIVTGPERGKVWPFAGVGIVPTVPGRDFLRRLPPWKAFGRGERQ
jgi:hypothetical protein